MAKNPDLALSSARPSTSARSRSSVRPVGPPTVISRDFSREVSAGVAKAAIGQGLTNLGASLSSFFQTRASNADQIAHLKALQGIEEENAEFAVQAANTVLQRPAEFKRAIETGDWSAFPDVTPEHLSRAAFIDTGRKLVGQLDSRTASQDPRFLDALNSSDNPDRTRETFLQEELKGADPLYAASFQSEFYAKTDQAVADRKGAIRFQAAELMRDRAETNMVDSLSSITGIDDLMPHIGAVRRSMSTMGQKAMLDAEDSAYKTLLYKAFVEGDTRALALVKTKDPGWHDGLSIEERFRDEAAEFARQGVARFGETQSREQAQLIGTIRNMAAEGDVAGAMTSLREFEEIWPGHNSEIVSIKAQLVKALGSQTSYQAALEEALQGRNPFDVSESRKVDNDVIKNFFAEAQAQGMDPNESIAAFGSYLRASRLSDDAKGTLGSMLDSDNPEQRAALVQAFRTIPETERAGIFFSDDQNMMDYLAGLADINQDPEAGYQKALETGMSEFSRDEVLGKARGWDSSEQATHLRDALQGALEFGGDQGFYDVPFFDVSPDDIDPTLRQFSDNAYRDLTRRFPSLPEARINDLHARAVARRAGMIMVNGEPRWTLTEDVQFVKVGDGREVRLKRPDAPYLEDAQEYLDNVPAGFGLRRPSGAGLFQRPDEMRVSDLLIDEDFYHNAGLLPLFETAEGLTAPLGAEVGGALWIWPAQRDTDMYRDFPQIENPGPAPREGMIAVQALAGDRLVGDRGLWRYNPESNTILFRYIGPDNSAVGIAGRLDERAVSGTMSDDPNRRAGNRNTMFNHLKRRMKDVAPPSRLLSPEGKDMIKNSTPSTAQDALDTADMALRRSRESGTALLLPETPEGAEFYNNVYTPFLEKQEGIRYFAYDDATGRRLAPGQQPQGDRTIGIGFNLDKYPNADGVLKQIGITDPKDITAVKNGSMQLSQQQVYDINKVVTAKAARTLWQRYKDVAGDLTQNQWAALLSLHHHGITQTPKMTAAIKAGEWETVAREILFNSEGGIGPAHIDAVRGRRIWEAMMLLGGRANQPQIRELFIQAKARISKQTVLRSMPAVLG